MPHIITRRDALRLTVGGTAALAFASEAGGADPARRRRRAQVADREGRQASHLEAGALRRAGRDPVPRQHRQVPAGDGHRDARRLRRLGGHAPAVRRCRQHRHGSRHHHRLERGPARLRRQDHRAVRSRGVSRQALRRLDLPRREVRQEGQDQQLAGHPVRRRHRADLLPQIGRQGGRLRRHSQRSRRPT